MSSLTGIELGVDSCVMARIRVHRGATQVSTVYGLHDGEALLPETGRGEHLRRIRRRGGFPRHAHIVAWGLHEGASPNDPATRVALAPLLEAGFAIDAVLSPTEALALLARQRPRPAGRAGAVWLSLNKHAAAIAIIDDGGELLYSRVFDWHYRPAATLRDELLQRYSLVAHLAPEVRHGLDVIRAERGATVDAVVTCGDLPDLRSLTMPLIEELDMEVETLDSLDGLQIVPPAQAETIGEKAPAVRLACAVGADVAAVGRREPKRILVAAAVAAAVLTALIWGAAQFRRNTASTPETVPLARSTTEATRSSPPSPRGEPRPPIPSRPDTTSSRPPERGRDNAEPSVPAATSGRTTGPSTGGGAEPTPSRPELPRLQTPSPQAQPRSVTRAPAPPESRRSASTGAMPSPQRRLVPLNVPLPRVNSILVSPDRRLAVVDGVIVHEGDAIGPRVLIRIEPGAVLLREPSGYEVRVPIRRKVAPLTGM